MDKKKWDKACELVIEGKLRKTFMDSLKDALKHSSMTDQEQGAIFADSLVKVYGLDLEMAFRIAFQGEALEAQAKAEVEKAAFDVAASENNANKLKAEANLIVNQSELVSAQRKSEVLRRKDLEAGVELKNQQSFASFVSILGEEDKRRILLHSSQDNVFIKKAELDLNYLKILSDDNNATIEEETLHERVKGSIDRIGTNSNYAFNPLPNIPKPQYIVVSDDGFDIVEPAMNVIVYPQNPKIGEKVRFIFSYCNADRELECQWLVTELATDPYTAQNWVGVFKEEGFKNVCVLVKEKNSPKTWTFERRIYVDGLE